MTRRPRPALVLDNSLDANTRNKCKPRANKRENAEDLLQFSLPPRVHVPRRTIARQQNTRSPSHARDRFIHAQYRFILNPQGDYTAHFCDPDIHFHWPDVLQVLVATTNAGATTLAEAEEQENFCPICLNEPSAARMTKCGHVFCWSFLEFADYAGKWTKCPVCSETIHTKDLKSVRFVPQKDVGEAQLDETNNIFMSLRLMQRPQLTTLALPRSSSWPSDAVQHLSTPWHFTPDAFTHARFMLATPEYMIKALNQDSHDLGLASSGGQSDLEASFVEAAKVKVGEQIDKAERLKTPAILAAKKQSLRNLSLIAQQSDMVPPEASTSSSGASSSEDVDESLSLTPLLPRAGSGPVRTRKANLNPQPFDHAFHFYQASSGANVFLHPLDIRILKSYYNNYSDFPDTLRVKIEGREEGSANEDLRRRCRYLSHLPTASDITFLEVEWETILPAKTLEPYEHALKIRRNRRKDRVRREDRARLRSEEKDREKMVADVFRNHSLVPQLNQLSFTPSPLSFSPPVAIQDIDDDNPVSASPPSPSLLGAGLPRTVWGTRLVTPSSLPNVLPQATLEGGNDEEDYSLEDAWADFETKALRERLSPKTPIPGPLESPAGSAGKRKKQKVTLSLASGGRGRL